MFFFGKNAVSADFLRLCPMIGIRLLGGMEAGVFRRTASCRALFCWVDIKEGREMKKRILSLVLAALLCMGLAASAMAAEEEATGLSIQWISLSEGQRPLRYNRKLHWLVVEDSSTAFSSRYIIDLETGEHIEDFNDVSAFSEGLARVGDIQSVWVGGADLRYGFVDQNGNVIVEPKYAEAGNFSEGLAKVGKDGKYGFVDKGGKVVVPLEYDVAGDFSDGLAPVGKSGKYGFVDQSGQIVIPLEYDTAGDFSDGLARVWKGSKGGAINTTGQIVIPLEYDEVGDFCDGLARVGKDGKYGFVDKTGQVVVPPKYDWAGYFSDGLAGVRKGEVYGFIDKTGQEVTPLKYDSVRDFSNGLAQVNIGTGYGFVDQTGQEVIPMVYDSTGDFFDGLAFVAIGQKDLLHDNRKWGFIDHTMQKVVPTKYEDAGVCTGEDSDTLFWVKDGEKYGIFESPYRVPDAAEEAVDDVPGVSLAPAIIAGVLVAAAATAGIILLVKKKKLRPPVVILMSLGAVIVTVLAVFWLCPVHYKWKLQRQLADMVSIGKSSVGGTSGITGGGQMNIGLMLVTGVVMLLVIFVLRMLPKWRQKSKKTAAGNGGGQAPTHTPPSAPLKQEKPTQSDQTPAPVPAAVAAAPAPTQPSSAAPSPAPAPTPAAESPRFCSNCGKPLAPGVNFCPGCGHDLRGGDKPHEA